MAYTQLISSPRESSLGDVLQITVGRPKPA
jgi:hypothetical protein